MDVVMPALVVNFFGGPGAGKSTLAYELVGKLKRNDYKAELVVEHAKWLTYSSNLRELNDQIMLTAHDNYNISLLEPQVDVIVLDGSLLNGLAYSTRPDEKEFAIAMYQRHRNVGYILPRKPTYMKYGRKETHSEAIKLDGDIVNAISFLPQPQRTDLRTVPIKKLLDFVYTDIVSHLNNPRHRR